MVSLRYLIAFAVAVLIVAMLFNLPWLLRSLIPPPVGASEVELTPGQMRVVALSDLVYQLRWLIAPLVIAVCVGAAWFSGKPTTP